MNDNINQMNTILAIIIAWLISMVICFIIGVYWFPPVINYPLNHSIPLTYLLYPLCKNNFNYKVAYPNTLLIVRRVFVSLIILVILNAITSIGRTNTLNNRDYQTYEDAGFIKGFEIANTSALEDFCSDSGYIPYSYINQFKKQFNNTILNADNIIGEYGKTEDFKAGPYEASTNVLKEEFANAQKQYKMSKKQYCQMFDYAANTILSDKIKILKDRKPNMYKD